MKKQNRIQSRIRKKWALGIPTLVFVASTGLAGAVDAQNETQESEGKALTIEAIAAFEEVSEEPAVDQTNEGRSFEEVSDQWSETYTYLADTQQTHSFFETVEKNGEQYTLKDVQYQVTPLTTTLLKSSDELWSYAAYEPEPEIEEAGVGYTFSQLLKEEWTQENRSQKVTQYRTFFEGQEVPEMLEIETADEVTGETVYGTISRTDLREDGADWQENSLEQWEMYRWNGDSWVFELDGDLFYATEESPWFEGCEQKLLQDLHLDASFYQITAVEWYGDGWQDEDGEWKRSVRIVGNQMVPRYQAVYSGEIPENDLPMVRYTAQYTSEPQGYLIAATATYEKTKMQLSKADVAHDQAESSQFSAWLSEWEQTIHTGKIWSILLAMLAAIGVGLQTAVIFAIGRRS